MVGTGNYTKSPERGFRKLAMAFWDPPTESTIHGMMRFNLVKTQHFQRAVEAKFGVKPTVGQLMGRAAAVALKANPQGNAKIIWGQAYIKDTVDVYYQVDVEDGKDLSGVVIPSVDSKTIVDVNEALRARARKLREGKDEQYEQTQKGLLPRLPSWLLRPILGLLMFMEYNLGTTAKWVGAKPEPFGTVMVTDVSNFGIDVAYAPLVPVSRVPFIILVGEVRDMPWVTDGKLCVRPTVVGAATIDHRIMDGNRIGKISKLVVDYMQNPYKYETALGLEEPWEGVEPPPGHPACNYPEPY